MVNICEACRQNRIKIVENIDDPNQPYRLCKECDKRLKNYSLRPIEWYNLASIHGPSKLHDDFYDDDGNAMQPEEMVLITPEFIAPNLSEVSLDLKKLLDFATTRYYLDKEIIEALKKFDKLKVLDVLRLRVSTFPNYHIENLAYQICARVVGTEAEVWIRQRWGSEPLLLFSLAEATAACLPLDEGYNRVLDQLKKLPDKELPEASTALSWFRNESTLDWIDSKVTSPISSFWGRLAAISQLTWDRVVKWLDMGRPHSFLALDTLNAFWRYDTLLLKEFTPKLLQPDSVEKMTSKLLSHRQCDPVPRVRQNVDSIIKNWVNILQ